MVDKLSSGGLSIDFSGQLTDQRQDGPRRRIQDSTTNPVRDRMSGCRWLGEVLRNYLS